MIKKRYIFIPIFVVIIGVLVIGVLGYILFLRNSNKTDVVFAATEVGTPVGPNVTKEIGPAGGTLASPDGRLTLTVPPNALTETLAFSMQPITNKAGGGLGPAYRLEPSGKTFTTPLQISIRYDEHDLEGTVPAALLIAYQDDNGAWLAQKSAKLDQAMKTITVSTTHFTDWSFLSRIQLLPTKATLHPGESQVIFVVDCKERGLLDRLLSRPQNCESAAWADEDRWSVTGPGTYESSGPGTVIYTAPGKKPTPNIAHVSFSYDFEGWDDAKAVSININGYLTSDITIVDQGYKATGSDGPTTYSGTVCDLTKPFTVIGHSGPLALTFEFTPSGDGRAGRGIVGGTYSYATWTGNGPYTIEGFDSEKPKIVWVTDQTVSGLTSGSGTFHIDLVPLTGNECGGGQ